MKIVKILLKVLMWLVIVALVVLATLPLWIGPIGKSVANAVVPGVVKTDFHLGQLSLNPYTARFEIGDLQLSNPIGYSEKYAVTVGDVVVDAKVFSLSTDTIHVEEIKVKDIFVSFVSGGPNEVTNFQQIQYNIAGGKEQYEAQQAQAQKVAAQEVSQPQVDSSADTAPAASSEEKSEKKIIIDRLEISGLTLQLGFIPLRLPSVVLTDIGKDTGGATLNDVLAQILAGVMKAAGVVGDQLKVIGDFSGEAAKKVGALATETSQQAAEAVTTTIGTATEAATDAANVATDAMKDSVKVVDESVKAVGDSAKKALKTFKGLLKKEKALK